MNIFLIGAFGLMANILIVISVMIYSGGPPPIWLAWPLPPLLACFAIGIAIMVLQS